MSNTSMPARIEAVRAELASIRADLSEPGSHPHAELHDLVKAAEKTFTINEGSLPTYYAQVSK